MPGYTEEIWKEYLDKIQEHQKELDEAKSKESISHNVDSLRVPADIRNTEN